MKTFAVLGATGAAGSSVLRHLLLRKPCATRLHLYVRSKSKLLAQNPSLLQRPNVSIFEAALDRKAITARSVLACAVHDADYIFACIGNNESPPQLSVAADTADAINMALSSPSSRPTRQPPPTVVALSSSCLNPLLSAAYPWPILSLMHTALSNSCNDLRRAEGIYRSLAASHVLSAVVFAQPGSLMASDVPTGYELSIASSSTMLGYADLGGSMVEMAERSGEFNGQGVGVVATGLVTPRPAVITQYFVSGLLAHFVPGMWPRAKRIWAVGHEAWRWFAWGRADGVSVPAWRNVGR